MNSQHCVNIALKKNLAQHHLQAAKSLAEQGCAAIAAEPDVLWGEADLARLSAELALPVVPVAHLSRRSAEIAARFFGDPSADMSVIGITGTNGKTSVGHFRSSKVEPKKLG